MAERRSGRSGGFTLVEILVVILIIAVLTTLLIAGITHARRQAEVVKAKQDLAAIATAVEQYKQNFKYYPMADLTSPRTILVWALIAPGDNDGAPGPGFRVAAAGKKWEPMLKPDTIPFKEFGQTGSGQWAFIDQWGGTIRYYPKRRNLAPTSPDSLVTQSNPGNYDAADGVDPDRSGVFPHPTALNGNSLKVWLGDVNKNNTIDADEQLRHAGGFILATAGRDGQFNQVSSPGEVSKSDDLFNFER